MPLTISNPIRTVRNRAGQGRKLVLSASTLAGDSVRNSAGDQLGKVDEIMIDIPSGQVAYAVLSFGGAVRMGNKLFAVPWNALRVYAAKAASDFTPHIRIRGRLVCRRPP